MKTEKINRLESHARIFNGSSEKCGFTRFSLALYMPRFLSNPDDPKRNNIIGWCWCNDEDTFYVVTRFFSTAPPCTTPLPKHPLNGEGVYRVAQHGRGGGVRHMTKSYKRKGGIGFQKKRSLKFGTFKIYVFNIRWPLIFWEQCYGRFILFHIGIYQFTLKHVIKLN